MVVSQDVEELEEWLEPLGYDAFWEAMENWPVFTVADRDHCDGLIAGGDVPEETILNGLKSMAISNLREGLTLPFRWYQTHAKQGAKSIH